MTVRELINELIGLDPDLNVVAAVPVQLYLFEEHDDDDEEPFNISSVFYEKDVVGDTAYLNLKGDVGLRHA